MKIDTSNLSNSVGSYTILYSYTYKDKQKIKSVTVNILSSVLPSLILENFESPIGVKPDYYSHIKAIDESDPYISSKIEIDDSNVDYYNELVANGRGNELNDFIFDDVIEEEVQSVATVDEKNLKPAKEKQVGNKKKSTEKKPKKEESNALTIVEMQAPIQAEQLDYKQRVINAWNFIASRYETTPKIQLLSEKRLKQFKNSLKFFNMDERTFFNRINETLRCSKYLRGLTKDWRADFDWFINPNNALKAFEGRYKDNPNRIMEILQDPASMSFREAQEAREKLKMEQWLHNEEEAEEQKALPQ